jgi:MFS family permease
LIPIYLVRVVKASDSWISYITMAQTAILIIGYFVWTRVSRRRGSRTVLLWTTLGISHYTLLIAFTEVPWQIALLAGFAGIFQAGLDLVLFDELIKTVQVEYSAVFVSVAQMMQYLAAIIAPMLGSLLADSISLQAGLIGSAILRFLGFVAFFTGSRHLFSARKKG